GAKADDATADAAAVRELLPPSLQPVISASFIRSHLLYEEFVDRLALRVARETGLEAATRKPASAQEVVAGLGLEARCALVPLDWVLPRPAAEGTPAEGGAGARRRFPSHTTRAVLGP